MNSSNKIIQDIVTFSTKAFGISNTIKGYFTAWKIMRRARIIDTICQNDRIVLPFTFKVYCF